MAKYVVYQGSNEIYVMTKKDEKKFLELDWAYDLERIDLRGKDFVEINMVTAII